MLRRIGRVVQYQLLYIFIAEKISLKLKTNNQIIGIQHNFTSTDIKKIQHDHVNLDLKI